VTSDAVEHPRTRDQLERFAEALAAGIRDQAGTAGAGLAALA
jgi:hypothetical protein